ncbi:MAG: DedA family protein [Bdellovibrionaceae bacterium]|nr:DedA family protein [Pseudobdellovibrionaceae bacterium]
MSSLNKTNWYYQKFKKYLSNKYNKEILFFLSILEAIIFPFPIDPLLIGMGVLKPKKAWAYSWIVVAGTVTGAIIAYALGLWGWQYIEGWVYTYLFSPEKVQIITKQFHSHSFLALFLASFTPIPFKVFTLTAGAIKAPFVPYLFACIVGRICRFVPQGIFMHFYGKRAGVFLEKYFNAISLGIGAILLLVFFLWKYL